MSWARIESGAYWFVFVAAFLGVAIWESFRPRRTLSVATERRWANHGLLLVVCTILSAAIYRASPVVLAASVAGSRFGLLNKPWLPFAARCILTVLVLDLVKYVLHRACHSVALLWSVHQVHHSDPDFDVSTAFRVHPIELIFTQLGYFGVIAAVAPPPVAVLIAELATTFHSFVGHANARFPEWLRWRLWVGLSSNTRWPWIRCGCGPAEFPSVRCWMRSRKAIVKPAGVCWNSRAPNT